MKLTINEKLERKRLKTINRLSYSAASLLREADINETHDVNLAWANFRNIYLPQIKPIVEHLISENKSHIYIPRLAINIWMNSK